MDRIVDAVYASDMFATAKKYIKLDVVNSQEFKFEDNVADIVGVINKLQEKDCIDMIFADNLDVGLLICQIPLLIFLKL